MKFVLNSDRLFLRGSKNINSGSINYYEIPVEYDSVWNDLSIKAIMRKKNEKFGEEVAVINNKFYIDKEKSGEYLVGFIGYTIENEIKTIQISTNLISINIETGAGEIAISDTHEIPTTSEWEIYIAQMQEITNTINGLSDSLKEEVSDVEAKLENGEFNGKDGKDGENGRDGVSPSITIEQVEDGVRINIEDKDGTTSAILNNGEKGEQGEPRSSRERWN